jgi:hypothetical protein
MLQLMVEPSLLRLRAQALVQALRPIEPGEELYADYGDGYWRKHGSKTTVSAPSSNRE